MRTVAAVFAIGDRVEAEIELELYYVLHSGVLNAFQLLLACGTFVHFIAGL